MSNKNINILPLTNNYQPSTTNYFIPPRIVFLGDQGRAADLTGFAMSQLELLKEQMRFQGLFQGERTVEGRSGVISCAVRGQNSEVQIYVPTTVTVGKEQPKEAWVVSCWCTRCFSEGIVKQVIGEYGHVGYYTSELPYPMAMEIPFRQGNLSGPGIWRYSGIRYRVDICQGDRTGEFICVSSDFAEYKVNDKVVVLFMGRWKGTVQEDPGCHQCLNSGSACAGNYPKNRGLKQDGTPDPNWNRADGTYIIIPAMVVGLNKNNMTYQRRGE